MTNPWKPFATAPRKNRPILACNTSGTYIVRWDSIDAKWMSLSDGRWSEPVHLTHWADLPPTPHDLQRKLEA